MTVSSRRRQEIVDALRRGTVPHSSLDAFAVGLDRFEPALEQELLAVKGGVKPLADLLPIRRRDSEHLGDDLDREAGR